MSVMPKLKIKEELNYRRGSTNEYMNCRYCKHFVQNHVIVDSADRQRVESRCRVFGLNGSIRYRVRQDFRCDAHEPDDGRCWWRKGDADARSGRVREEADA